MFKDVTKRGFHSTQNDEEQYQGNNVVSRMSTAVGRKRISSQEGHIGSEDVLSSRREENPKTSQTSDGNSDSNASVASRMSSVVVRNRMSSQEEQRISDDISSNETDSRRDISVAGRMSNAVGRSRTSSQERRENDDISSNQERQWQGRIESPQNPCSTEDVSVRQRISIVPRRSRNGETSTNIQQNGGVSSNQQASGKSSSSQNTYGNNRYSENQRISIVPTRKRAKENDSENVNVSLPEITYQNISGEQKYNNPTRGFTGNISRIKTNRVQESFEESQKSVITETETPLTNQSNVSVQKIEHGNFFVANGMASGGKAPYKYAYYYKQKVQKSWTTAKDYSTAMSVSIKPAKATAYDVCIKVKDASGNVKKKYFDVIVVQGTKNTSNISAENPMTGHNNVNETERISQNEYEKNGEYEFRKEVKVYY